MTDRIPRTSLPGYFQGISNRLREQVRLMTPIVVHSGEMGHNDQTWFADLLQSYLPSRIGVGTGFVVNSKSDEGSAEFFSTSKTPRTQDTNIGPQSDILLVDELDNAPFCCERTFKVFPVEMVLATLEITRDLDSDKLHTDLNKIARVRTLAQVKQYAKGFEIGADCRKPLGYIVGLGGQLSLQTIIEQVDTIEDDLRPNAILILEQALYVRRPYTLEFDRITEDILFHFISMLRHQVETFPRGRVNLRSYVPAVAERCWLDEQGLLTSETPDDNEEGDDFETSDSS
jgi:hypothetical protein